MASLPPQPVLHTPHLRLRPFLPVDAAALQRLAGDFAVAHTTLNIPHPYEDGVAEAWITLVAEEFTVGRQVVFAITDAATSGLLGAVGLVLRLEHARAELGYWIGRPFWGRGYATEAVREILRYGFRSLGLHRIHASHFVRNPASGRVMVKAGMRYEGVSRAHVRRFDRFEDLVHYGILREEFEAP